MSTVPAPDGELTDLHGRRLRLSELWTASPLVLAFFPLAFSPTCTRELAELQAHRGAFADRGVALVAVSVDSTASLAAFGEREGLDLPLLSDFWPHGAVARAFDALDERKGWARRVTVAVDEAGGVRDRFESPAGRARTLDRHLRAVDVLTA